MHKILLALAGAALSAATVAFPAYADSHGTPTTFTLSGGDLIVSVPASAPLGSHTVGATSSFTVPFGQVTVTDNRGSGSTWEADVQVTTTFSDGPHTIDADKFTYDPGGHTATGGGTISSGGIFHLSSISAHPAYSE